MRPLIIVTSCQAYTDVHHRAIRATWGRDAAIPYIFLVGGSEKRLDGDVLTLPVPDDYKSLCFKTREGHRWAREQGHDFIFQAFADTYCFTHRMMRSGFERFDYVGHFRGEDHLPQLGSPALGCYASGGSGYWMSPRFTDRLIEEEPDHWAEDLWVGRVSRKHGIAGTQDYRYFSAGGYTDECLTSHLSRGTNKYDPSWMGETHKRGLQHV